MGLFLRFIALSTLAFSLANTTIAGSVRWHNYSSSVFSQAKKNHTPVMLFAMSDSCLWCKQMIDTTFSNSNVARTINKYFYPVILHADRDRQSFKQLRLIGIPTVVFFSENGSARATYEGYLKPSLMLQHLSEMR